MTDLQQRQQLEDIEAIKRLKDFNYCYCVDLAVSGDNAAAAVP